MSRFPRYRPRRTRATPALRSMVRETEVRPADLILPLFVTAGEGARREVAGLPGVFHTSVDGVVDDAREAFALGIPAVLLFGVPSTKDERGSGAWDEEGDAQRAVRALRDAVPELVVITDVCLCAYTSHGQCGVLRDGAVANDETLELLARQAISHAHAGAHVVAPSDMMDGRVATLRHALDDAGYADVAILSHAVKYASAFYMPLRDADGGAAGASDGARRDEGRRAYQMDPANVEEALREARLDVDEGADILMVKPALASLDVIWRVKQATGYPVCAYHVSGEYAAVMAAARNGWVDERAAMTESLTAIKRAGADMIVTYWARRLAEGRGSA